MSYFHNKNLKILNFTHCDFDGAVCNILLRNYYPNLITECVSHNTENTIVKKLIKHHNNFDAIVFTDFCPTNLSEVTAFGKPVLVLDHHDSLAKLHNPSNNIYICSGFCGATLTYKYFYNNTHTYDDLVNLANDFDLYILNDPRSRCFNTLFWDMGFNWFVNRFYDGDTELSKSEKKFLVRKQKEYADYYAKLEVTTLGNGGVFCATDKFIWEIFDSLMKDGYKWCVIYRPGYLSVRSAEGSNIDLVSVAKTLGMGGGHEYAIGISMENKKLEDVIMKLDKAVDTCIQLKLNPPSDAFMAKLQNT